MGLGTLIEKMFVSIQADLSGLTDEMNRAANDVSRKVDQMSSRMMALGDTMMKVGGAMSIGVSLPLVALGRAAVNTASDVEEMTSKFNVVFGSLAGEVAEWSSTTARELNRSKFDLMDYASALQDTFVPMGFARDKAADLSMELTQLGIDLASFNNRAEPEVLAALQSAIVGNHETMRQFGVVITETTLNQKLLEMGIKGGTKAATEQQKILARLEMIMQGTSDAQGDAARTADGFANRVRGMQAAIKELLAVMGQHLLPVMNDIVSWITKMARAFTDLSPTVQRVVIVLGAMLAGIGPVVFAIGLFTKGIVLATRAMVAFTASLFTNPLTALAAVVAAAVGGFIYLALKVGGVGKAFDILGRISKDVMERIRQTMFFLAEGMGDVGLLIQASWSETIAFMMDKWARFVKTVSSVSLKIPGMREIGMDLAFSAGMMGQEIDQMESNAKHLRETYTLLRESIGDTLATIWSAPIDGMADLRGTTDDAMNEIMKIVDAMGTLSGETVSTLSNIKTGVGEITDSVKAMSSTIGSYLDKAFESGKFSLKELTYEMVKTAWIKPAIDNFAKVFGALSDKLFSNVSDSFGKMFEGLGSGSGSGGNILSTIGSLITGIFAGGKAVGGVVPPWKSFIAGERGAELIEQDGPSGARRVSTAGRTAMMGSGGGMGTIHVNVTGARGNAEITSMVQAGVREGLSNYDRAVGARVQSNIGRRG